MVQCFQFDGDIDLALHGSPSIVNEVAKQKIMDLFWLIIFAISIFLISSLGRVKASRKQLSRNNRINWVHRSKKSETTKQNIIEGESHEVSEDDEK